jgi:hypothetical protein
MIESVSPAHSALGTESVAVSARIGLPALHYQPMRESHKEELMRILGGGDARAVSHETVPDGTRDGFALVRTRTEFWWRRRANRLAE